MRRSITVLLSALLLLLLVGCSVTETKLEKLYDLEYTIVKPDDIPKEVLELIQDNKSAIMKLTYTDQGMEYIIVGYGTQKTSGYSVEVLEIYETENVVVVDTNLLGPGPEEEIVETATFPYIVLLIEENKKPVVFD